MTPRARLAAAVKRHPRVHRGARRLRAAVGGLLPPRRVDGIPGRVHRNDFMFLNESPEEVASYRERAGNVIALVEECLTAAGGTLDDVERWLDFGCGYGRVVRFLVERVPPERVWVADVISEGVDFCRSEFGVDGFYSDARLAAPPPATFDFVYAISVISHLDEERSEAFLRLVGSALREGGIAMFTAHGDWSVAHAEQYGAEYGARKSRIAAGVRERGVVYFPYSFATDGYGIAWHSREYVERTMARLHGDAVAPLLFRPHGLDGHQDVYAFRRAGAASA